MFLATRSLLLDSRENAGTLKRNARSEGNTLATMTNSHEEVMNHLLFRVVFVCQAEFKMHKTLKVLKSGS